MDMGVGGSRVPAVISLSSLTAMFPPSASLAGLCVGSTRGSRSPGLGSGTVNAQHVGRFP